MVHQSNYISRALFIKIKYTIATPIACEWWNVVKPDNSNNLYLSYHVIFN